MTFLSEAETTPFAPEQGNTCVGSVSGHVSRKALLLASLATFVAPSLAWEDTCSPFGEIYSSGKDLCERIFDDAFEYTTDEDKAYTMWFFDKTNPNKATAGVLGLTVPDTCDLSYYHKEAPSAEGSDFTECLPWKEEACCKNSTVVNADAIKEAYGKGYEWDRCGVMSAECERFFVQEACFYECDLTAGLYRKCSDAQVEAAKDDADDICHENYWKLYKMPIKASYCDAWYSACFNDRFCSSSGGDFFGCNALYWEDKAADEEAAATKALADEAAEKKALKDAIANEGLSAGMVAIIVVAVVLVLAGGIFYIFRREKQGNPIFQALDHVHPEAGK